MISDAVLFLHRSYDTARVEAEILVLVGLRGPGSGCSQQEGDLQHLVDHSIGIY